MVSDEEIKRKLIQTRKAVKRKLQALRESAAGQEMFLSRTYEPITKSIKNLKTELADEIKAEIKREQQQQQQQEPLWKRNEIPSTSTPIRSVKKFDVVPTINAAAAAPTQVEPQFLRTESIGEINTTSPSSSSSSARPPGQSSEQMIDEAYQAARQEYLDYINSSRFNDFLEDFNPSVRYYVEGLIKDFNGEFNSDDRNLRPDKVRYEWDTNKFFIGDSELNFEGSNICVGNVLCYKGSVGLYELLFKMNTNYPYSIQEKKDYADILKRTSALYSFRTQTTKPAATGRGMLLDYNEKPVQYVYFDDVNELCDRLKLLIASQNAGNTNHSNEIVSILEELRECGIIE